MKKLSIVLMLLLSVACLPGCGGGGDGEGEGGENNVIDTPEGTPEVSLAWSEYPSWSVFGVADELKLVAKEAGKMGPIEQKHGVDLVLTEADYDTCITLLANSRVDAACITNMDALNPSLGRPLTIVQPTSTSDGADACITVGDVDSIEKLKGIEVRGLEKSVSEYTFERNVELAGEDPADYNFRQMDPAAAAQAMQTGQSSVEAIVVWNP